MLPPLFWTYQYAVFITSNPSQACDDITVSHRVIIMTLDHHFGWYVKPVLYDLCDKSALPGYWQLWLDIMSCKLFMTIYFSCYKKIYIPIAYPTTTLELIQTELSFINECISEFHYINLQILVFYVRVFSNHTVHCDHAFASCY